MAILYDDNLYVGNDGDDCGDEDGDGDRKRGVREVIYICLTSTMYTWQIHKRQVSQDTM